MKKTVRVLPSRICGIVPAPASKSYAQRAVAAAVLSAGQTRIENYPFCADSRSALRAAQALGAGVDRVDGAVIVTPGLQAPASNLRCGESGLCIRMFAPIAALESIPLSLHASGTLRSRPMESIVEPLTLLGARCRTTGGRAPIRIRGPMTGGDVFLDGTVTSQFLTGLLMALPRAHGDSLIRTRGVTSLAYVDMTLDVLTRSGIRVERFGEGAYRIAGGQTHRLENFEVEGDWSGAAFLLTAAALAGCVTVQGLNPSSLQGDSCILEALSRAGARVRVDSGSVRVSREDLKPFSFSVAHCPDLAPPLAALAAGCPGTSRITDTGKLVYKETNRSSALVSELGRVGVEIRDGGDFLEIRGGSVSGGTADSRGDHRISMALAVAALVSRQGITIRQAEAVSKSYPAFFRHMRRLGAGVDE